MLDSDFWRDLADKFRRIDPDGILQAAWTIPFPSLPSESWEVFGTGDFGPSILAQFKPLAIRAGLKLDKQSQHPVDVWLSAIKAYGPQVEVIGPSGVLIPEPGFIKRLCQISADFCNVLESLALEAERHTAMGAHIRADEFNALSELEAAPESETLPTGPEPGRNAYLQGTESSESVAGTVAEEQHRRKHVAEFLKRCNAIAENRVLRRHIWLSVGHSKARQFEYWQRGDAKLLLKTIAISLVF